MTAQNPAAPSAGTPVRRSLPLRGDAVRLIAAFAFMVGVYLYAAHHTVSLGTIGSTAALMLAASALIGAYMAMNIGANDVANNMGPAVGARALSMGWAIAIAAVFEGLGAIVAGEQVVGTIKGGIIDPALIPGAGVFATVMLAALMSAAVWLNIATAFGAPVSTTHSIVGAVMGAGIAASGWATVNWNTMGAIVASWVISPLMGGVIAAAILYFIKRSITYRSDMNAAAARVVPWLIGAMAWAFGTYMMVKGLGGVLRLPVGAATIWGLVVAGVVAWLVRRPIVRKAQDEAMGKDSVNALFTWPLIFAAALLSFAHGANDVGNAIGPLAAIYESLAASVVATRAQAPLWIMVLGALGLAVGLALYGAKIIRVVGDEITDLDRMRAYAIAMAAAITVIVAAQLGMPISTTHVTIGAVFGVGFLRELLKMNYAKMEQIIIAGHPGDDRGEVEAYLARFEAAPVAQKKLMLAEMKQRAREHAQSTLVFAKRERKALKRAYKRQLVKRSLVVKIVAAWIVTVPATALLSAAVFHGLVWSGLTLP